MALGEAKYPHLFSPGRIGTLAIANRFVRSATAEDFVLYRTGRVPDATVDLYRRLARSRIGLLVFAGPVSMPRSLDEKDFEAWKHDDAGHSAIGGDRVPGAVHAERPDARILGQLGINLKERPSVIPPVYWWSSTGPEMTKAQIARLAESFAIAIARTKQNGYDGAQLHAGHGTLLSLFLSPYGNRRTDEYGGSPAGRTRVLREIVDRARDAVGDYPILIKANATDHIPGGIDETVFPRMAEEFQRIGFDAIEITGGMWDCLVRSREELGFRPTLTPESRTGIAGDVAKQSYFLPFVKDVDVDIPLILTGGNRNVDRLETIIHEASIDFVGMCRPLIREPELVDRWRRGIGSVEAACLACNSCVYLLNTSGDDEQTYRPDVCPPRDHPDIHAKAQRWLATWVADELAGRGM